MTTPIEISQEQLSAFQQIHSNNFRPVQSLNDRHFLLSGEMDSAPAEMEAEMTETAPTASTDAPATLPQSGGVTAPGSTGLLFSVVGLAIFVGSLALRRRIITHQDK